MSLDLGFDYKEALERQNIKESDIELLREKVKNVENVPQDLINKQLMLFLDACGSVEEAAKVIKIFYDAKFNAPEHFTERDPDQPKIQQCLQNQEYFHLPTTPEGYSIVFHRLSSPKPSNYHIDEAMKTFFMTIDSCLYTQGPRPGIIFLFDMKGVSLGHLLRIRISSIKKFFHYLQEGLPAKLQAIHIFNVVGFFDKILSIMKPFMKAEIFRMLHPHPSSMDYEEFYEKCIPKSCLPSDFGGDLPEATKLHEDHCKEFLRLRDYFIAEEKQLGFDKEEDNETDDDANESDLKNLNID